MDPLEISKQEVKNISGQLDFLNGEVGRVKGVLKKVNEELTDTELKKANAHIAFNKDFQQKESEIKRISDHRDLKLKELTEINSEVAKNNLLLEDQKRELAAIKEEIVKVVAQKTESENAVKDLGKTLESLKKSIEKENVEIQRAHLALNERGFIIQEREDTSKLQLDRLEVERREVEHMGKIKQDKIDKAAEIVRVYEGRSLELDNREEFLKKEKENFLQLKTEEDTNRLRNLNKEAQLKEREEGLVVKEADFQKRESASIRRETDVILREAECRIREKALNIANREKQLDEQI